MTINYANIQTRFGDYYVRTAQDVIPVHRFRDVCRLFRIPNDGFRVQSLADADRVQDSLEFINRRFGPENVSCQ